MSETKNNRVVTVDDRQRGMIETYGRDRGWEFSAAPYAFWKAKADGLSVVAYESGKLTVQGKKSGEFIDFVLEPEIIGFSGLETRNAAEGGEPVSLHGGIDESGKGDFFGPLVIAGACVDAETAPQLAALGVRDSKLIKSTAQIYAIGPRIRAVLDGRYSVVAVGNEAYNRLYAKIGNLNRLLAWGHARVIENLLGAVPDCPRMLSDKFGDENLIRRALMEKGRTIVLDQKVRAESDVAVAAASILARERFLHAMDQLSSEMGITLPRGASDAVNRCGEELVARFGLDILQKCAKLHFKTYESLKNKQKES
ncbi:MAG: ribonuclease HIII [Victivallaceae bacterium]|nr:ribonuclease HIII [Victivallaceae bacterium]